MELIDVRTDVYAFGMMLYHILTGQDAYNVTGPVLDVLRNIQGVEPIRPSKIIRKFDPDIEAIVLAALAKDRASRYQSVAGLQGDIENWLANRPINVRAISTLYLMRKVIARHRYVASVVGLLLVIILSFSFLSFQLFLKARKSQRDAEDIAQQWADKAGELKKTSAYYMQKLMPMHFTSILEQLHEGRVANTRRDYQFFDMDSKEYIAAEFLISPQPLKDKEAEFRRRLGEGQAWFADFVIGEHYLKDGRKEEALNAYRSSYNILQKERPGEVWMIKLIESRLYELTAQAQKPQEIPTTQAGD